MLPLILSLFLGLLQGTWSPPYETGLGAIRVPVLRGWVEFLAAPELEGRESGERGFAVACRYAETVLKGLGVAPGGADGTYFQEFRVFSRRRPLDGARLVVRLDDGTEEAISLSNGAAVSAPGTVHWKGTWVFVGHGEACDRDSPDDFHGLPLEGRTAFILPPEGKRAFEVAGARARGIQRAVVVSDTRVRRREGLAFPLSWKDPGAGDVSPRETREPEVVYVSSEVADRILGHFDTSVAALRAAPGRPRGFPLEGAEFELNIELVTKEIRIRNVLGVIEGSDPRFRHQAVVVGAHLDHVGVDGENVFHGADDNASGSAAVLGVARALMATSLRPRRSVVVALFGGEEKGLLGSRYYVEHPTIPVEDIVLMINLDMVGRDEERISDDPNKVEKAEDNLNTMHLVGSTRRSRELKQWILDLNDAHSQLVFEYDAENVFHRSDQHSFAAAGVPVAFLFSGFHRDYHKSGDTPGKINWGKLQKVTRLAFALAFEVADRERRLVRNHF